MKRIFKMLELCLLCSLLFGCSSGAADSGAIPEAPETGAEWTAEPEHPEASEVQRPEPNQPAGGSAEQANLDEPEDYRDFISYLNLDGSGGLDDEVTLRAKLGVVPADAERYETALTVRLGGRETPLEWTVPYCGWNYQLSALPLLPDGRDLIALSIGTPGSNYDGAVLFVWEIRKGGNGPEVAERFSTLDERSAEEAGLGALQFGIRAEQDASGRLGLLVPFADGSGSERETRFVRLTFSKDSWTAKRREESASGAVPAAVSAAVPAESGEEFQDAEVQARLEEFLAYFTGYPALWSFTQEDCSNVLTFAVYKLESEQDGRIIYDEEEERYVTFLPEIQDYIEKYFDIPEVQGSPYGDVHYIEKNGKIVFYQSWQPRGGQPEIDAMRLMDDSCIAVWGHIQNAPQYVEGLDSIVLRDFRATIHIEEDDSYRLREFTW